MGSSGAGTLYVVATPIGNLGDITLRAIETLKAVDRVVAEDTRRTRGLLSHLGISGKPLDSIEAHATGRELDRVVARLEAGEQIAMVTDAGMPSVSDPGTALARAAIAQGIPVVAIPGASAVTAAIAASGLVVAGFRFVGFLPRSGSARRDALALVASTPEAVVLFEAPGRLADTLTDLAALAPSRPAAVMRELTKLHEEATRATLAELSALEREWVGEITLVVGPDDRAAERESVDDAAIERRIDEELAKGTHARDVAERVAAWAGKPRREIYAKVIARRG